jgi:hypothetical protein
MTVAVESVDSRGVAALAGGEVLLPPSIFHLLEDEMGLLPSWDMDLSFEACCGDAPWPATVSLDEMLPDLVGKVADAKGMDTGQLLLSMLNQVKFELELKKEDDADAVDGGGCASHVTAKLAKPRRGGRGVRGDAEGGDAVVVAGEAGLDGPDAGRASKVHGRKRRGEAA